jgi:hypothetical protein
MKKIWKSIMVTSLAVLIFIIIGFSDQNAVISAPNPTPTPNALTLDFTLKPQSSVIETELASSKVEVPMELVLDSESSLAESTYQTKASTSVTVTLALDDGSVEDKVGRTGAISEFFYLNRFSPGSSFYPIDLTQIWVYFNSGVLTYVGDHIRLAVYQDSDGNPMNGATFIAEYPTTIQALDAWNTFVLQTPLRVTGPGDILISVIVLENRGTGFFPAALDTTSSAQRSWIGYWTISPPPSPPTIPPGPAFGTVDNAGFPGNWLIRAFGTSSGSAATNFLYLPTMMKSIPPPVLNGIYNPNGSYDYSISWSSVTDATSYVLEEDDHDAFSSPNPYSGSETSKSITYQAIGTYYYRVKAVTAQGTSAWSNVQSTTVTQPLPPNTVLPGYYSGSSPTVSFDVTEDRNVCNFRITVKFGASSCSFRPTTCKQISNNTFKFEFYYPDFGITDYVAGVFDSPGHAVGDWKITLCGDTMVFPASTGNWAASKR